MVMCPGQGADLHMAQLIPLLLTVSCYRKTRLVLALPFCYLLTRVVPDIFQKSSKTVVCVLQWLCHLSHPHDKCCNKIK